jgi:hypothetical protein
MTHSRFVISGVVVLSLARFGAVPALAHHSFAAEFDANAPITVQGVITQVRLENPTRGSSSKPPAPAARSRNGASRPARRRRSIRSGVKPGFIKPGDQVTIKGYHARDASQNVGAGRELVTADGRAFAIGPMVGPAR